MNATTAIIVFFSVLAVVSLIGGLWRSRYLLGKWAAANGFTVLKAQLRVFRKGPMTVMSSSSQWIFYVDMRDKDGKKRRGWARAGSYWGGLWSDEVEVRWDDYGPE